MDGCDGLVLEPPAAGHGIQLYTDMVLAPGEERQTCKLVMPGEDINWGDGVFTVGSHHATVWRTSHTGTIPTVDVEGQTHDTTGPVDFLSARERHV
ncbi:MAG TPA: hypothetical protein VH062_15645 [Polyangiaceae bacterium]|jgi:hypothetical protein|nr:hypothetical protein [Polyangiaceae bacterium]